jgi:hypothetical protein
VNERTESVPIELFVQALSGQLDRAQTAMAMKARLRNLPLTFAVKDISLDLNAYIEVRNSVVYLRPAGPGDTDASTLHVSLTTITKSMIEENSIQYAADVDEPSLKEALGDSISDEEQQRLEWVGVHTVSQLRELKQRGGELTIQRLAQVPAERLQAALMRASEPRITRVLRDRITTQPTPEAASPIMRIHGDNLLSRLHRPIVRIAGEAVPILQATEQEIVIAPLAHQLSAADSLEVEVEPGVQVSASLGADERGATQP